MALVVIDLILNVVALLLWLNWRSLRFDPLQRTTAATLVGTLKPAEARRGHGWPLLVFLVLVLGLRAVLYWEIASPADWTPKLDLGLVVLAFRSDLFRVALVFSVLSFLRVLIIWYFWLLFLGVVNRRTVEADPLQRLIRQHLGRVGNWPWPLPFLLLWLGVLGLWLACHPLLHRLGVLTRASSTAHLVEQGALVGLGLLFSLKYLLPVFLGLYLITSYVFLGNSPLWDFVTATSRNLLAPLRWLPLRLARIDLAPVVGVVLVLLLLQYLPNLLLVHLARHNLTLWPQ